LFEFSSHMFILEQFVYTYDTDTQFKVVQLTEFENYMFVSFSVI